ncbi:hypothetical protein [Mesorhizobium sp. WSM2239]|uniref:Uncharacterized protein n=2 Tax=unclassified Mesorhizobium TaxID=325217 RepID=A0AAU8D2H7_9HYPH
MPRIAISSGPRLPISGRIACCGANGPIVASTALSFGLSRCDFPADLDFGSLKTKEMRTWESSRTVDPAKLDAMAGAWRAIYPPATAVGWFSARRPAKLSLRVYSARRLHPFPSSFTTPFNPIFEARP